MDQKEAILIAKNFLNSIQEIVQVESAYLFGSYSDGTQRPESDIDIGLFIKSPETDYFDILSALYRKRIFIEPLLEPYLFISGEGPLGFGENVKKTGVRLC